MIETHARSVPALTMEATSEELGMSLASMGALNSIGAGLKSVLIIFLMGPALDHYGPHTLILGCLIGTVVCNTLLALSPDSTSYTAVYLLNYVFNSFSEQPAHICLYATYFHDLLGICTTTIASAFSLAGFMIPPALSPLSAAYGWRSLWLALAGAIVVTLPLSFWFIKPGPAALHDEEHKKGHGCSVKTLIHSISNFGHKVRWRDDRVQSVGCASAESGGRRPEKARGGVWYDSRGSR